VREHRAPDRDLELVGQLEVATLGELLHFTGPDEPPNRHRPVVLDLRFDILHVANVHASSSPQTHHDPRPPDALAASALVLDGSTAMQRVLRRRARCVLLTYDAGVKAVRSSTISREATRAMISISETRTGPGLVSSERMLRIEAGIT
jgi:hypothetical protein